MRGLERELSFPRSILNIGKLDALKTQLAQHPLSQFAKPEDILTQLSVLPDTRYTPRVTVSPYSLDIFARNILPKGASTFESPAKLGETIGMAVRGESQTYLKYNKQRPVGSGKSPDKTLRHEWAHQVEFKDADYDGVYGAAAFLERDGFNLTKRARVQRHSENQAVHMGEGILSYPHQPYEATAVRAPIRSAVMAVKLRRILDAVPEEDRGLFHQHYLDRVQRMEKIVFPEARKQLSVTETKSDYMKEQVERLLSYLKPKDADVVPY